VRGNAQRGRKLRTSPSKFGEPHKGQTATEEVEVKKTNRQQFGDKGEPCIGEIFLLKKKQVTWKALRKNKTKRRRIYGGEEKGGRKKGGYSTDGGVDDIITVENHAKSREGGGVSKKTYRPVAGKGGELCARKGRWRQCGKGYRQRRGKAQKGGGERILPRPRRDPVKKEITAILQA